MEPHHITGTNDPQWLAAYRKKAVRLESTILNGANIEGGDLSFSDATGASLQNTILLGAQLPFVRLAGDSTTFLNTWFSESDLSYADLSNTQLDLVHFSRAQLFGANLSHVEARYAQFSSARMESSRLYSSTFYDTELSRVSLNHSSVSGATFWRTDMQDAQIRQANLAGCVFLATTLARADLGGADLVGSDLGKADLTEAQLFLSRLEGSDLTGANLDGANVQNARFDHAVLFGTELHHVAGLVGSQLSTAIANADTRLPQSDEDGMPIHVPHCWQDIPQWPQLPDGVERPRWWDDEEFHRTHLLCPPSEPESTDFQAP
ncbi:MAG: pentapeptide repeat-containing protein [Phycisphaerales bacterium]